MIGFFYTCFFLVELLLQFGIAFLLFNFFNSSSYRQRLT